MVNAKALHMASKRVVVGLVRAGVSTLAVDYLVLVRVWLGSICIHCPGKLSCVRLGKLSKSQAKHN